MQLWIPILLSLPIRTEILFRFELLDIVEYKEDEYAVLYPADGGDDEPVHILRIISENLDVNEAEFEGLDDDELIDTIYQIFRERNDLDD